jgi:hypothetical protein
MTLLPLAFTPAGLSRMQRVRPPHIPAHRSRGRESPLYQLSAAGALAPISSLLVVLALYVFRPIYGEVGTAMPLNGGT